jgi:hypothetical protein
MPKEDVMHDPQRIYDAMLIKAFRADITLGALWVWLKPYRIKVPDPDLKRQPPSVFKMRVQVFVGWFLKPLADRLWDTDRTHDIKTLDWMANLESQDTNRVNRNEKQDLVRKYNQDRGRGRIIHGNAEAQKASNQWHVTKVNIKQRRM